MSTFLHQIIEQLHDQPNDSASSSDNTEEPIVTDEPERQLFVLKTE